LKSTVVEVLAFDIQCSFTRCRKTQAKLNRVKKILHFFNT